MYDLLFGKQTIQGGGALKKAIIAHKNALITQLARLKIKAGVQSNEELLPPELRSTGRVPRFARVNRLKVEMEDVVKQLEQDGFHFAAQSSSSSSSSASSASASSAPTRTESKSDAPRSFRLDAHVPDLLVFPPGTGAHSRTVRLCRRITLRALQLQICMTTNWC